MIEFSFFVYAKQLQRQAYNIDGGASCVVVFFIATKDATVALTVALSRQCVHFIAVITYL